MLRPPGSMLVVLLCLMAQVGIACAGAAGGIWACELAVAASEADQGHERCCPVRDEPAGREDEERPGCSMCVDGVPAEWNVATPGAWAAVHDLLPNVPLASLLDVRPRPAMERWGRDEDVGRTGELLAYKTIRLNV